MDHRNLKSLLIRGRLLSIHLDDKVPERSQFPSLRSNVNELLVDRINCRVTPFRAGVDFDQLFQILPTPPLHVDGVRGTEHAPDQIFVVAQFVNFRQLVSKASHSRLEKLVRLVDDKPFNSRQIDQVRRISQNMNQTVGRADEQVEFAGEFRTFVGTEFSDVVGLQVGAGGEDGALPEDLLGQFAGWRQDQSPHSFSTWASQGGQDWDEESGRFARPGRRSHEDVSPLQQCRNRLHLHGCRPLVPERSKVLHDVAIHGVWIARELLEFGKRVGYVFT